MANFANYRLPVPETKQLASLHSVRHDLLGVLDYCGRLNQLKQLKLDHLAWDAVCSAAVVRYARCFASGVRVSLEQALLNAATEDIRQSHEFFIAVRNKHVAHSVNEFEETDVTVTIRSDDQSSTIQGLSSHQSSIVGLPFDSPARLETLVSWVLEQVKTAIAKEEARLLPLVLSMGVEKIVSFGQPGSGPTLSNVDPRKTRARP